MASDSGLKAGSRVIMKFPSNGPTRALGVFEARQRRSLLLVASFSRCCSQRNKKLGCLALFGSVCRRGLASALKCASEQNDSCK